MKKPLSKQRIFNTVYRHLMRQGRKASNEYGTCAYRGANNDKCAIGCLITDEEYKPSMEGFGVNRLFEFNILPKRFNKFVNLLSKLQRIHDAKSPDTWKYRLKFLARLEGLTIPSVRPLSNKCKV